MTQAKSEASTTSLAEEVTFGVNPAANYTQMQPNPGGIQGMEPTLKYVERDPLSKYAAMEKGDTVGLDAAPKLVTDWNKDVADKLAGAMFRCVAKHPGNTTQSLYRPTGVTATGYTTTNGALTAGLIVHAKGFLNAANNGYKVVGALSTAIEIKATGLVVETAPANATVDVVGVQGAAGDIQIDVNGDLISTTLDLTTLGLVANVSWIELPTSASFGGAFAFANALYAGRAKCKAITATKIVLERRYWTVGAADAGAAKTIRIGLPRTYRNVTIDHADYREPSFHGEIEDLGAGTGSTATYTYATGMSLKTVELDAPLESKIVTTLSFVAKDVEDPVLAAGRKAGPSAAYAPLAGSLVDTATDLKKVRLGDAANGDLLAEINSWKLTIENNVKAQKIQGSMAANQMIFGKFMPTVTMDAYWTNYQASVAARDNRPLFWDAWVQNDQFGFVLDMPYVALRGLPKTYAANESIMVSASVPGFRDPTTNVVMTMSVFGAPF